MAQRQTERFDVRQSTRLPAKQAHSLDSHIANVFSGKLSEEGNISAKGARYLQFDKQLHHPPTELVTLIREALFSSSGVRA